MSKFWVLAAATSMILLMLILAITSMWDESATMDEGPHISAGYTYIKYKDMRLNPEHPPIIKDLAGLALQFINVKFQNNHPSWTTNINDQWITGPIMFYESGNDADKVIRTARLGVIGLLAVLGFFIFKFARNAFGTRAGLIALFLYSFSPTFLAHGRYVTTDVAAALGFFIGILFFIRYLKKRTRKAMVFAGLALGIALTLKFSTFILIPIVFGLGLVAAIINWQPENSAFSPSKNFLRLMGGLIAIYAIAFAVIYIVYIPHVWNYPAERQYSDSAFLLSSFKIRFMVSFQLALTKINILRPIAQYLLGLFMVLQRATGGNTTYFLGEVSASGWSYYFPVMYAIKEQLVLHILTVLAIFLAVKNWLKNRKATKAKNQEIISQIPQPISWIKKIWIKIKLQAANSAKWLRHYPNFVIFAAVSFLAFYWLNSIVSNLNIGVRHVLPTLPFVYLLVANQISDWLGKRRILNPEQAQKPIQAIKQALKTYIEYGLKIAFLFLFGLWYLMTAIVTYPYYLSYFNEIVGGPSQGHKYAVDSNLDWGQDLKRLTKFVNENNIEKIRVDYFGSGSPKYYLGDKYQQWWSSKQPHEKGWYAISATFLMGSVGKPAKGFTKDPADDYSWLYNMEPEAKIGNSIFVYKVN